MCCNGAWKERGIRVKMSSSKKSVNWSRYDSQARRKTIWTSAGNPYSCLNQWRKVSSLQLILSSSSQATLKIWIKWALWLLLLPVRLLRRSVLTNWIVPVRWHVRWNQWQSFHSHTWDFSFWASFKEGRSLKTLTIEGKAIIRGDPKVLELTVSVRFLFRRLLRRN